MNAANLPLKGNLMTEPSPVESLEPSPPVDAYGLLSKPTLDLSPAEVKLIVADLRERRKRFAATAKPDNPKRERAAKAPSKAKATAEERKRATEELFANLKISI